MNNDKLTFNRFFQVPLLLLLAVLTGCASRSPISQLSQGDEISFHATPTSEEAEGVKVTNAEIGKTTLEMGGGGALGGAALGFGCGPWFFFCVPVGFVYGAAIGTTAGLVIGSASTLDSEIKGTITEKFNQNLASHNIEEELIGHLTQRSNQMFAITERSESNRLHIQLRKMQLDSYDEGVALIVQVLAKLEFIDEDGESQTKADVFHYSGRPMQVESWVMADDNFYQQEFTSAYHYLTEQITFNLLRND